MSPASVHRDTVAPSSEEVSVVVCESRPPEILDSKSQDVGVPYLKRFFVTRTFFCGSESTLWSGSVVGLKSDVLGFDARGQLGSFGTKDWMSLTLYYLPIKVDDASVSFDYV